MRTAFIALIFFLLASAAFAGRGSAEELACRATEESLVPIRPGVPGKAPFWNEQAKQFLWAPAFDFHPFAGATAYRFNVVGADGKSLSFVTNEPWSPLTPIWTRVPTGPTSVKVEAFDKAGGEVIGLAGTREFHRGATFYGPYGKRILPYDESARIALRTVLDEPFVRYWRTNSQPDPTYALYRYPSKIIGSLVSACVIYANESPRPKDADDVILISRHAADYLMSISAPADSVMEFFPPTYYNAKPTDRENDHWTMLVYPADVGQGYLDLYEVTHDERYLLAARRIAHTYAKLQLPSGTWPLKVDNRSAEPLAQIDAIPCPVIDFLDRLVTQYHLSENAPTLERAVRWMMENPVRTFNWQAQFEDAKLRGPYQNLGKHEACAFVNYLLRHPGTDSTNLVLAEDILRFAEDQFVVWEQPPELVIRGEKIAATNWFTPAATEQYAMFEPISGSSAFMITSYVRAWKATGNPLYRAKAESLANALTEAQQFHHGRYPTRLYRKDGVYWLNSTVNTARAMSLLADQSR